MEKEYIGEEKKCPNVTPIWQKIKNLFSKDKTEIFEFKI